VKRPPPGPHPDADAPPEAVDENADITRRVVRAPQ
jgi:hypothetical protein